MIESDDIEWLAAEYVLGSMPPEERKAVAARRAIDPRLAAAIVAWERLLTPLSHSVAEIEPPHGILESTLADIANRSLPSPRGGKVVPFLGRERRWRRVAIAMSTIAACLAIALGAVTIRASLTSHGPLLAVLSAPSLSPSADEPLSSSAPKFLVTIDRDKAVLSVRQIGGRAPSVGKAYALWLVPDDGALAKGLGWVSKETSVTSINLKDRSVEALPNTSLGVSVEPVSPLLPKQPSGALVSVGKISVVMH